LGPSFSFFRKKAQAGDGTEAPQDQPPAPENIRVEKTEEGWGESTPGKKRRTD